MPEIRAILFDMDGTLINSRNAVIPAIEYALRRHGISAPTQEDLMTCSHSLRAVQETLAPAVPYDDLLESYDERLQELLNTITIYEHADAVLRTLHTRYKLAIASSSRRAEEAVTRYGLGGIFDAVVGGLDVAQHKPHPAALLLALEKLDVAPAQAVMVGDLPADITAGMAAGTAMNIGITHGSGTAAMLQEAGADYLVSSLTELQTVFDTIEAS